MGWIWVILVVASICLFAVMNYRVFRQLFLLGRAFVGRAQNTALPADDSPVVTHPYRRGGWAEVENQVLARRLRARIRLDRAAKRERRLERAMSRWSELHLVDANEVKSLQSQIGGMNE